MFNQDLFCPDKTCIEQPTPLFLNGHVELRILYSAMTHEMVAHEIQTT